MTTPKLRAETSGRPRSIGRQAVSADEASGQRILESLASEPGRDIPWLAVKSGVKENTLRDAIKRGIARADVAIKIAKALGVDLEWLLTGAEESRTKLRGKATVDQADQLDLVPVGEIDLAYGLGGTYSDGPVETQILHFPRSWLETITHTPAASLTFARGRGDSMQPTMQDGDIVLIDRSIRTIREQDAIWALTVGDIAMIKRVRVKGPMVSILSDNERVPPDEAHFEEVNVVGRVVFIGRKL